MSKTLVLAEKPSVGRDIARVLKCTNNGNGYIEGQNYIVTWALGHLVTLADPEKYEEKYKQWRIDDLPILPKEVELEVIPKTGKQYQTVKSLLHRQDVSDIVIATDAGREGELVARWILVKANVHKPLKRLWISSVTDKAINEGFRNLKDGRAYETLYYSAQARAEADWYVGINGTRALTCKYNAQLSCGRVQTPTLALIALREDEINNFKPQKYYGITAKTNQVTFSWQDSQTHDHKTFDESKIDLILNHSQNKNAEIIDVNKSYKKTYPKGLYDLTELQRDANRIFNFSAKDTLSIMQSLYEHHKILTYPRTDSRYISTDVVDTLNDRVRAVNIGPYVEYASKIVNKPIKASSSFVDNAKVSDHHAIIPTEQRVNLTALSDSERKVYDLVVKRFLAVLYPPFEYEQTTIKARINNETFIAKGKLVISLGFKAIYGNISIDDEESDDSQTLPEINKGDILKVQSIVKTTGTTKPPAYYNEGTLLSVMENPVKYMETTNKDLIKTIGETGGLGTVATRADIIEKLFNIFLIEKKGKDLFTTSKGKQLLNLVPVGLKSPILTATWEQKLSLIAKGKLNKDDFIHEMKDYAIKVVNEIKNSEDKFKHDNLSTKNCPNCGKLLLEVNNKDNKMLVCQDRSCGYRKVTARVTNARCPVCHKKLELVGEGEGQLFICKCGHKEKLSTFTEKKKTENKSVSKHEVSNYLNRQEDVSVNSSLADALMNLKNKK
ncbi:MAG: topB1 [Haloplasmataceae bacterium]|jgi:DNA topoisomerase-3|nr:topB1 [Haloplasmataceae bacterium]